MNVDSCHIIAIKPYYEGLSIFRAGYQVKNRMPLIIKAMNESIAKTWSNEMGLGIIAATTYFDKTSTFKNSTFKDNIFKNSTFKNNTFKLLTHF
ncbi:hypothetical protein IPZ60_10995 [Psychrobacter sp. NG25]|jgi:hypothetical protein|uniref:hypothetical protein n=1 Tax=Psychrobacter sp. NG25 TaxID=2782005 RepID=UPI001884070E|nr:hypothetical protein [Psychrobacter sp. NG25]MBF0659270.1 hypothetical protein [Psychrobacter sp. NG25]